MSQTPNQYEVFLKIHDAFIKMCAVSIKTLEIIEQEKKIDSITLPTEQKQMAKIVIERFNLFQEQAFIDHVKGDKVMSEKQTSEHKIEVLLGENAKIFGDFVIAESIKNSFNKAVSADISDELKELLKALSVAVSQMSEKLPKGEADDLADDLRMLVEQATQEKPKRKWWSVSVDGLTKAAKNLGQIGQPVLDLISRIVPVLEKIST